MEIIGILVLELLKALIWCFVASVFIILVRISND